MPHPLTEKPVIVLGAGAVGCLLGAFLAQCCGEVVLFGRAARLEPLKRRIEVRGLWGNLSVPEPANLAIATTEQGLAAWHGRAGMVLVCGRAPDTGALAAIARRLADPVDGIVISVQNGLGNWERLRSAGLARIGAFVINTGVEIRTSGRIDVTVHGRPMQMGAVDFPGVAPDAEVAAFLRDELQPMLSVAGVPCQYSRRLRQELWKKVIYNCALNAPSAARAGSYRKYFECRGSEAEMRAVILECYGVAQAHGIELEPPTPDGYESIFFGPNGWLMKTLDHEPSMLAHLRAGKETEIDALNGMIERLGAEKGVVTPVNARHAAAIRALSRRVDLGEEIETIR